MNQIPDGKIILENGQEFTGFSFGAPGERILEIVFNTSMVGYQEILSDPSYTDQAVVMTYPLIGNYGMNPDDYETRTPTLGALIVREYNDEPSHYQSQETLGAAMARMGIPGISGVDTRRLNRIIRDQGSMKALITGVDTPLSKDLSQLQQAELPRDAVSRVSCREIYHIAGVESKSNTGIRDGQMPLDTNFRVRPVETDRLNAGISAGARSLEEQQPPAHIVLIDCGMKRGILRALTARGCEVTIVPWNTEAEVIRSLRPDGVLISNGPGNPEDVPETIRTVRALLGEIPLFGICLGHQILSLAYGVKT